MGKVSMGRVPARVALALCLGLSLLLAGCAPLVQAEQAAVEQWVSVGAGAPLGQTFVADFDGLQALWVLLEPESPGEGTLTLHLRADPLSESDLGVSSMPLAEVTTSRTHRFDFPPLARSNQQDYYAFFEVEGEGSVRIALGPADAYLNGAAYQNHQPLEAQMVFLLAYAPGLLGLGLAREMLTWAGVLGAGLLLYLVPGWALLALAWPGWERLSWGEKAGLAAGTSLALAALLALYSHLVGIQLGAGFVWLPLGLGGGYLAWRWLRPAALPWRRTIQWPGNWAAQHLPDLTLAFVLLLIFGARFWLLRGLDAPLWGDSLQHTMMTQLILDWGGLFESWQPYAPYASQSMQFGFPLAAAQFSWLSGSDSVRAVLWEGQLLNGLAAMALYPLALRLAGGQRWAGVGAVLAAGLLSPMPAFYLNWGRYAQLAGLVVLPVGAWMVWDVLEEIRRGEKSAPLLPRAKLALAGMVLCGMVLCQYRMPFLYLAFVLAWLLGWGLPRWRLDAACWQTAIARLSVVALVGIVFFLPWGVNIMDSNLGEIATTDAAGTSLWNSVVADFRTWLQVTDYLPGYLVVLALAAWLWGLLRREWAVGAVGLWVAFMASIYSWILLGIPGALQVPAFAVLISLYIPAGILFGWLIGKAAGALARWKVSGLLLALAVTAAGLWAAWGQADLVLPGDFALVTRPDTRAMAWIRENTPPEARFLVEAERVYWNTAAVGTDAGWWLPLLAECSNTMPPLYALGTEAPLKPDYSQRIIQLVANLETTTLDTPEGLRLLCAEGVTHVYIGQSQGLVGATDGMLYTPQELADSAAYQLVYRQDRVWIFALSPGVCDE